MTGVGLDDSSCSLRPHPAIMGAGGFIMAKLTGEPCSTIMLVAVFPALMYF